MFDTAQEMYRDVKALFDKTHLMLQELTDRAKTCPSVEEHVDLAYAMRECTRYLEDMRKECKRLKELCEKIGCVVWVKNATGETIRTKHCSAVVDVTMIAVLPKEGSKEYERLMDHFGVPKKSYDADHEAGEKGAVRVHWPGCVQYLSQLALEGKPLPPGIDMSKTYPKYAFKPLRKRKDVGEN